MPLILTVTPSGQPANAAQLTAGRRHAGIRVAGGAASGSLFWGLCATYGLAFAVTDAVIAGTWLVTVAWISDKARMLLRRPRHPGRP